MILAQEFTSRCHIFKTTMKDMNKARGMITIMIQYLNKVRLLIIFSMH